MSECVLCVCVRVCELSECGELVLCVCGVCVRV